MIAEAAGTNVKWNEKTGTVFISSKEKNTLFEQDPAGQGVHDIDLISASFPRILYKWKPFVINAIWKQNRDTKEDYKISIKFVFGTSPAKTEVVIIKSEM